MYDKFTEKIIFQENIIINLILKFQKFLDQNLEFVDQEDIDHAKETINNAIEVFYEGYFKSEKFRPKIKFLIVRGEKENETELYTYRRLYVYWINYIIYHIDKTQRIIDNTEFIERRGLLRRDDIIDEFKKEIQNEIERRIVI